MRMLLLILRIIFNLYSSLSFHLEFIFSRAASVTYTCFCTKFKIQVISNNRFSLDTLKVMCYR